jgi:tetratricopeptide (TPR) repeat protein
MKIEPLIKASKLACRGKYEGAIKILEPMESHYYNSFNYYYLLAVSYLNTGVYGSALTNFSKAKDIKTAEPRVLLGLAALYLNHGDTDRAVDYYLEILEIDENNKLAGKALRIIRKNPGPEKISAWIERGRFHTIFPAPPKISSPQNRALRVIVAAILAACLCVVVLAVTGVLPLGPKTERKTPMDLALLREDLEAPMQLEGSFRYVLTRDQVNNYYNEARRLFTSYHDEGARVNLNRILESNGPEPVKNKARLLLSYLETPGFDTLKDKFSFAEANQEPILYRDCHVIWRGIATNIDIQQNRTSFDLLVGYDTRRTMEGIVRVDFDFAIPVNPERPVEILGRIVPINTERGIDMRIQGIALNQAGLLDL